MWMVAVVNCINMIAESCVGEVMQHRTRYIAGCTMKCNYSKLIAFGVIEGDVVSF